jgi:hypothetical protein
MKILNKHHGNIPPDAVYIGRGSKWGNPFVIGKHGTRDEVIEKYRQWIVNQPQLLSSLHELRGKDLACFCSPAPCHGMILKELVNGLIARSSVDDLKQSEK